MRRLSIRAGTFTGLALVLVLLSPRGADAVELIKDLKCALTQTTHTDGGYCLKVFNTCNTSIISRIQESDGTQKDSAEVRSGERGKLCALAPFVFLGHHIAGPLAQGAGD